jgi:hypothetical protein
MLRKESWRVLTDGNARGQRIGQRVIPGLTPLGLSQAEQAGPAPGAKVRTATGGIVLEVEETITIEVDVIVERGGIPAIERDAPEWLDEDHSSLSCFTTKKHAAENGDMLQRLKFNEQMRLALEEFHWAEL